MANFEVLWYWVAICMNSAESLEKVEVYVALGFGSIVLNSIGVDNNVVFTFESNK